MSGSSWDYEQATPPLNDTKVDRLKEAPTGQIDQLASLDIDIPDHQIIQNLNNRIQDSEDYWNARDGYNLATTRSDNVRAYLGKQLDVRSLYRFQIPYVENQLYIAIQTILAYTTASQPTPEVYPSKDTPQAKKFAMDLEKVLSAHSHKVHLQQIIEACVRNALLKRVGIVYFDFDPTIGKNGEIIPTACNPEDIIVDKNVRQNANPAFICRKLKMSVNEACRRWPEKREEIYKGLGIIRGTYKQLESIIVVNEVWLTYYDKEYQPQESVVYYFEEVVLEKTKNWHWLYSRSSKNFLDAPMKPFIFLNFDNDGTHAIDQTSAFEQASQLQLILNKRGRQYMEVLDKANGTLVIDTRSGITKADSQDLTGDPNQHIVIQGMPGVNNQELIFRLPPPQIPTNLENDKMDLRTNVHAIMGTPGDFTGAGEDNGSETLGEAIIKKNQAAGRQDLYVRAIDRFMSDYFNMLVQMMVVWYDDKHYFAYNSNDGEFDHLVLTRDFIDEDCTVMVKSGTTLPFDKQRQEAISLQLLKMGVISPLDAYKLLHMQNPQQLYDNFAKYKSDPMALARDAMDEVDESKAYVAYVEIMSGKKPEEPNDCTKEFVLTLRKLMLRDEFMKAPKKRQNEFLKYVDKAIASLATRTSLDQASQQGVMALNPALPLQPPMPPQQPQMAGQPPMPSPQGAPAGMMGMGAPMSGQQTVPAGQPGQPAPTLPIQGGNVTAGLPLPNPNNPQTPSPQNPMNLPTL